MSDPTPPAVSDAMREAVATYCQYCAQVFRQLKEDEIWLIEGFAFGPIASEIARLTGERERLDHNCQEWVRQAAENAEAADALGRRAISAEAETAVLTAECKVYRNLAEKYAAAAEAAEAETARLRAENERLSETYTDEDGTVWSPPTAWAYFAACRALHAKTAALAEAKAEGRRQGLEEAATVVEDRIMNDRSEEDAECERLAERIRSLATAPAETQKPETGDPS